MGALFRHATNEITDYNIYREYYEQYVTEGGGAEYSKKQRDEGINKSYNYTDRFLPAAHKLVFKRLFQMSKDLILHPLTFNSYDRLEKNLLDLVKNNKSIKELEFLRRDAYAGKHQMKFLSGKFRKEDKIDKAKEAENHLKWIENVYQKAISDRMKKIKALDECASIEEDFSFLDFWIDN